jgi:hypothetical protein
MQVHLGANPIGESKSETQEDGVGGAEQEPDLSMMSAKHFRFRMTERERARGGASPLVYFGRRIAVRTFHASILVVISVLGLG